jgi:hypothetical protein
MVLQILSVVRKRYLFEICFWGVWCNTVDDMHRNGKMQEKARGRRYTCNT